MRLQIQACLIVLLSACHHAGSGAGTLISAPTSGGTKARSEGMVDFRWHSGVDASDGTIEATLPNGKVYTGKYLQIRAEMETDTTGPHFVAWSSPDWAGDPWYGGPPEHFAEANTGKVVALLESNDGSKMRCKFELRKPDSGMTAGGTGECQLSSKEEIFGATLSAGAPR